MRTRIFKISCDITRALALGMVLALLNGCANPQGTKQADNIIKSRIKGAAVQLVTVRIRSAGEQEDILLEVDAGVRFTLARTQQQALFQWQKNGIPLTNQVSQTLEFGPVTPNDTGIYRCIVTPLETTKSGDVSISGGPQISQEVNVMVYSNSAATRTVTVYGTPIVSSGSSTYDCPGSYVGYVNYRKPRRHWGWKPISEQTPHKAHDPQSGSTKVEAMGRSGDRHCGTGSATVSPEPPPSTKYRFTIYFPSKPVPTEKYAIELTNFEP